MLKIAFCSCNHPLVHPQQPGWLALASHKPDVLLLLGDNVYVEHDVTELIGSQRPAFAMSDLSYGRRLHEQYALQWQVPQFRQALAASRIVMGTLDDHDFLGNDTYVSPSLQRKATLARLLHRQFIAACGQRPLPLRYPAFDEVFAIDDVGFDQGIGLAQSWQSEIGEGADHLATKIILLDNRSYREAQPHLGNKPAVALGAAQISWLAQELVGSQRLSIVASGSTFTAGDRIGIVGSPLDAYRRESNILRTLYASQSRGQRVIHLGGDLHYNAFTPWSSSHPFTELASSGMGSGWQPFAQAQRGNFGLLTIEASSVRMQLLGAEDERNLDVTLNLGAT